MKRLSTILLVVALAAPALAANKDMVQLQTQVQNLQDSMARMQQTFDERMGVMKNLIEQTTDNINRLNSNVDNLTKTLQQQSGDSGAKTDQVSSQVQALHDSVDEVKARLNKIQQQLDAMSQQQQNLQAPPQGAAQAPPPDVLYQNALRDMTANKMQLADQEFRDFMKYYPDNELAGNAQYYIADIEYRQGNFQQAVADYDKVLEQHPGGNKAAASQLKKGYALLELGQRDAGVRELNSLVARYPKTSEAAQAQQRLTQLGASRKPTPKRTTPR
ncbi:MAG: outer membrane protein assembly factor BamD [Candidatus Koribacter versatilis]|uniref:Outer membrane protein assembly factor BamD n=1 Tax=Candidatus Korobacter versatilis TaxID=658062 RepID=A0A932A8U3_9BACT|nr:outer membrane protein assembly factor BamD [Candidatus Koribacter versatilis]